MLVPPSPKSQAHDAMVPVEASVKVTAKGAGPVVGLALNAATGAGITVTITVDVVAAGLTLVLPLGDRPLPPPLSIATLVAFVVVQDRVVVPPTPMVAGLAVKLSMVGGTGTVIYAPFVSVSALPPGPLTVRLTG